jgi:hypothetical protein
MARFIVLGTFGDRARIPDLSLPIYAKVAEDMAPQVAKRASGI